ncbi:MAG: HAMP domain-containing protein [Saccharospirillum sp.]|nr:HAMP domain-containing protein [Saccharospirillum sp.]
MRLLSKVLSLRTALNLQVTLPILAVMALILAGALSVINYFSEARLHGNLRLLAQAISVPVSDALERDDLRQLENSLTSVFELNEVYSAYLFDWEGNLLVSLGSVSPSRTQTSDAILKTEEGEFAQYEQIGHRNVYSHFLPIHSAEEDPLGVLQVTRRRSDIRAELNRIQLWSWSGFGGLSLLFFGAISLAHQRSIGRPIDQLVESMQRVQEGDLSHRAPRQGPREIHSLAKALNGMLDAIKAAEDRANQQQQEREAMAKRLQQAETLAAIGQLSAGVAHELGAPLSVVDGRAQRLKRHIQDEQGLKELNEIRQQSQRMTAIIQQLLSYGRRSSQPWRSLSVKHLIKGVTELVREEYPDARIEVKSTADCELECDALSMEQALINLLRNALQASPNRYALLEFRTQPEQRTLTLSVEDDGPGITPEHKEDLFTPFFSTKNPGEGSGLGLAIVKRVVRDHQGQIDIRDSALGGACFTLTFAISAPAKETQS